jgi:hypothetical protein
MATSIRAQIAHDDQFPSDRDSSIRWLKRPFRVGTADDQRVVGVAQIAFKGITNTYCRFVATSSDGASQLQLIRVPEAANYDACKGVRSVQSGDLDGDGLLDFAYAVQVRSNKYSVEVEEVVVFLGQADKARPYCYSTAASRAVTPVPLSSLASAKASMSEGLRLAGKAKFDCDSF